jgi:hypothetical protein
LRAARLELLGGDGIPGVLDRHVAHWERKVKLELADLQLVAVLEPVGLDALAVDVGAVERAEVVEVDVARALDEERVGRARP